MKFCATEQNGRNNKLQQVEYKRLAKKRVGEQLSKGIKAISKLCLKGNGGKETCSDIWKKKFPDNIRS